MRGRRAFRRRVLGCALLSTMLAAAAMQASAQDVTVRGAPTCQEYMAAKRTSVEEAISDLKWLLGYMSGLAVATHVDILSKPDNGQSMLTWVDTYCPRYPARSLSDAGDLYFRFLKEQMKGTAR